MGYPRDGLFDTLVAITAVATLPIGLLAGLFLGLTEAAVVFVIGWLLLTPVFGILSGQYGGLDPDEVEQWTTVAERARTLQDDGEPSTDEETPLETLRERYARGEIDESEFEQQIERLVATEEIPPEAATLLESDEDGSPDTERTGFASASTERRDAQKSAEREP